MSLREDTRQYVINPFFFFFWIHNMCFQWKMPFKIQTLHLGIQSYGKSKFINSLSYRLRPIMVFWRLKQHGRLIFLWFFGLKCWKFGTLCKYLDSEIFCSYWSLTQSWILRQLYWNNPKLKISRASLVTFWWVTWICINKIDLNRWTSKIFIEC